MGAGNGAAGLAVDGVSLVTLAGTGTQTGNQVDTSMKNKALILVMCFLALAALAGPFHAWQTSVADESGEVVADASVEARDAAEIYLPRTATEASRSVVVVDYRHPEGDPRRYGAAGDGVTDDSAEFADAGSVSSIIPLAENKNYNLGSTKPVGLVYGAGKITLTGRSASPTVGGFLLGFDVAGSNILAVPEVWAEQANSKTATPGGINDYFNVAIAPGSNANDYANIGLTRSTIIGHAAGEAITEWERVEAIGSGAMRFAPYAQRTTAVGTIALQWLGATSQQFLIDTFHDFWLGANPPGHASWDFGGLETNNPGIGARIDAFSAYPTNTSTVTQNVAFGRDAGLHLVKGSSNSFLGYQSGAHAFNGSENTSVGSFSMSDGVFVGKSTLVGYRAGQHLQEGKVNTIIGHEAAENLVDGTRNIIIGGSAAQDHRLSAAKAWDNKFIVENLSNGHYLTGDNNIGNLFLAYPSDELADIEAVGSGFYNVVSASTIPETAGRFLGTATSSVSTFNSYADSASTRTHATFENANGVVGSISTNGSSTAFNTSSDARLKHDLGRAEGLLAKVMATPVHRYYRTVNQGQREEIGFFSQEIETIFPHVVTGEADGITEIGDIVNEKGEVIRSGVPNPEHTHLPWRKTGEIVKPQQIDYSKLVVPLWVALQDQQKQIEALQAEIRRLNEQAFVQ